MINIIIDTIEYFADNVTFLICGHYKDYKIEVSMSSLELANLFETDKNITEEAINKNTPTPGAPPSIAPQSPVSRDSRRTSNPKSQISNLKFPSTSQSSRPPRLRGKPTTSPAPAPDFKRHVRFHQLRLRKLILKHRKTRVAFVLLKHVTH